MLAGMSGIKPQARWFHPTPDRFVIGLLAVECLLWLSEPFHWFANGWVTVIAVATVGAAMPVAVLWFLAGLVFRCRFQFGVRSLLVLVIVVAIPCSLLATEMRRANEERQALRAIKELAGKWSVLRDYPSGPTWLHDILGDEYFNRDCSVFVHNDKFTDADFEHLKALCQLRVLALEGTRVTDAGLKNLRELRQLEVLSLKGGPVTDAGMVHLEWLTELNKLHLEHTQVGDAGLEHIKGLCNMKRLYLGDTRVTDAGLENLEGLSELLELGLENTQVTDAGLEHCQRTKPTPTGISLWHQSYP